jgi:predicted CXXCH cytochrome family protein
MLRRFGALAVLVCALSSLIAQDIDSVPRVQKRTPINLADQIADRAERAAFLQLFEHASPAEMRAHGENFIAQFPQSAFLAQAYEIAARACFDLADYALGLKYAHESLGLLPENPLLLVSVADVEARQRLNFTAIAHADDALTYLDRFAAPSSVRDGDWPNVKQRLQSTASFAKGRALLQEALAQPAGEKRQFLIESAKASLLDALKLNVHDVEITYALGLVQLSSGDAFSASGNFAGVYREGSELAPQALDNLHAIYRLLDHKSTVPFENFLKQATDRWTVLIQNLTRTPEKGTGSDDPPMDYFGTDSCRGCHAEIYKDWSESGMSKMFRPYAPGNVLGDFEKNNEFYLGDDAEYRDGKFELKSGDKRTLFAKMVLRAGRPYFEIMQSDQTWHSYRVDYTIGSKFEQAYATRLPNGEIHVFPIQYNLLHKQWVNFWKVIDGPGSERADPRTWERLDASTSYQAICAVCHTSQLRNTKAEGFDVNNIEFKEPGINCEMCHGPSQEHVLEMSDVGYHAKDPMSPPVNFHKIDGRQSLAICAQCHAQSAIRNPGPHGVLNFVSSKEFFGNRLWQPYGEFSRKGFYKDGRFRQTTFMVEALERSECFRKGGVTCLSCHDPHSHGAASNPTALKFRDQPDLMCTGCHAQFKGTAAITQHTHHPANSEASHCVSCHMPRIMDALLFQARYHQIDDIPNVEMTKRFGQEESPNACLSCHTEKKADWVEKQLSSWKVLQPEAR